MIVPFAELPSSSRVWIYPSHRKFTPEELPQITEALTAFIERWTAHNEALEASFEIRYDRFIVIGLNQEKVAASGCSIDASVHFIQQLEKEFDLMLLDKLNVDFWQGKVLQHKSIPDFKAMVKARSVASSTIVFNHLVASKGEYIDSWEIEAHSSWQRRFF